MSARFDPCAEPVAHCALHLWAQYRNYSLLSSPCVQGKASHVQSMSILVTEIGLHTKSKETTLNFVSRHHHIICCLEFSVRILFFSLHTKCQHTVPQNNFDYEPLKGVVKKCLPTKRLLYYTY